MSNVLEETEYYKLKYIMFSLEEENIKLDENDIGLLESLLPSFHIISRRWFHSPSGWHDKQLVFSLKNNILTQTNISLPCEDNIKINERRKRCKETNTTDVGLPVLYYPRCVDVTYLSPNETTELFEGLQKILPSSTVMWMNVDND